jgi:hypothetical protein
MKKIISILLIAIVTSTGFAQTKLDDFGRIILNAYLPENLTIPLEAKNMLLTKLNQITTMNGIGGSEANPRFIITAAVSIGTKDIIAGPPQMIAQNIDITLFVGDAISNTVYANVSLSIKGVGTNENKAFIEAIKTINPQNKEILLFLEEGKKKVLNYYSTQCDFIIKDAQTLTKQAKYDEAIYQLAIVPNVCKECYFKCSDIITNIYQQKIDADCKAKLSKAKTIWAGQQNISNAENVLNILSDINYNAACFSEVNLLTKEINNKLLADEKARLELALKKYNDKIDLEKKQIDAYKEVAIAYAKNQPKTITYNNIYWR